LGGNRNFFKDFNGKTSIQSLKKHYSKKTMNYRCTQGEGGRGGAKDPLGKLKKLFIKLQKKKKNRDPLAILFRKP
jgi:hypothetical protein